MAFSLDDVETKTIMEMDHESINRYMEYRYVRGMSNMEAVNEIGLQPEMIPIIEYQMLRMGRNPLSFQNCSTG